jgi:hypothetical protein
LGKASPTTKKFGDSTKKLPRQSTEYHRWCGCAPLFFACFWFTNTPAKSPQARFELIFFILHSAKCLQPFRATAKSKLLAGPCSAATPAMSSSIPGEFQVQAMVDLLRHLNWHGKVKNEISVANAIFRYSNRTVDNVWTLLGFVGFYLPVQGWVTQLKQFATWVLTCSLETSSNHGWIPFPCFMPLPFLLFGIEDITFEHLKRTCPNSQSFYVSQPLPSTWHSIFIYTGWKTHPSCNIRNYM